MKKYRYITILLCMLSTFYVNAEVLALSQRTISETNEPGFELDYIKNFKKNLSQRELAWLAQRESIVVGIVKPFTPPFEVITSDNKLEGISADILSVLAKLTGKNVTIQSFESQQQALSAVENRRVDILNISSLLPDARTESIGLFSSNVMLDNCAYLASFKPVSASISEPKIAYESSGMDVDSLASAYPKAMMIPFESIVDAYDAVAFGKADAVVGSISSLTYLNKSRLSGLPVKERTKISCAPLQFFIAGHNPPLKKIIDRLISEMQKSSLMGLTALRWRGGSYKISDKLLRGLSPVADAWLTSEPVVRVGLIPNDFPYSFIDPTRQWQGIIIDVLNNVRYVSGLSFDFISYDSYEALDKAMSSGHIDMIGNSLSDIYSAETLHSIYYNKDDFLVLISNVDETKKRSNVAVSKRYFDMHDSWSGFQYEKVDVLKNDREVMQHFQNGNTDLAIVPQYLADYYTSLSERPYKVIERVGPPTLQRVFSMKENNKPLLEVMNSAIASISPTVLSDIAYFWRITSLPTMGFYAQYADKIKMLAGIVLPILLAYILYSYRIHHELSTRKKLEKVLLGQLDLMQSLLDGLPHPVTLINADGTVIYSNKAFLTAVGYAKECTKGANLFSFFSNSDDFLNVVGKVVKDMGIVVRDNKINITGSLIDIQEWFIPYHNIYDDSTGVLWGWFDVTWRNEICRQLELSKHEADLANQAKSEFIATISHEIRTPINIINGFLTLVLERTSLCDIDREELEYTKSAADGLLCLVGDVLDVTKIEAGQLSLESLPINMGDLVHDVVAMFLTLAKEKKVALRLESQLNNSVVQLDPLRTKQILFNLIGNAVKFTHAGTVAVSVSNTDTEINISVQDSGIGIDDDKLADLFQPFVQVHDDPGYQGSGLGLSITKRLCELMGGSISISSKKGKGTKVAVILPYVPADPDTLPMTPHLVTNSKNIIPANINVLIIDDHPVNLILLRRRLLSLGFNKIHEAGNGWQALDIVKSEKIQVIITDCQMLGMDGFTLVKALRQYEVDSGCTRHIILGLTASGIIQDREKGIAAGMDACMFKPIDNNVLYGELMAHLDHLDLPELKVTNADNNNLLKSGSFVEMLQELTVADLVLARNAYHDNDVDMFSMLIHRIKGVFLMIKHDEIVNCCKEIESHLMDGTHAQQIIATLDRIQELMKYIKNES